MTATQTATLLRAMSIYDYQFVNMDLLWEAVQVAGSGITFIGGHHVTEGNKRLAIHGDSALQHVLSRAWYETNMPRGAWDRSRQDTLGNPNLNRIGRESGLAELLHVNPQNPVAASDKLVATLVEAVLGAVDLDGGLDALARVMEHMGLT